MNSHPMNTQRMKTVVILPYTLMRFIQAYFSQTMSGDQKFKRLVLLSHIQNVDQLSNR